MVMQKVIPFILFGSVLSPGLNAADRLDFATEIRPILSDSCFQCHGPDEGKRKADLRLDTQKGAMMDLGGYAAIQPGDSGASALVQRILTSDPDDQMPPPDSGKRLTEAQKAALQRWVDEGAEWKTHWAFVSPTRPEIPEVKHVSWTRNAIDHFVLSKLEANGMQPSNQADAMTLLRRLHLDLVGLPPSMDEVEAFQEVEFPEAYSDQVDELLQSSHYGERWGRLWLDAARYADSDGFEKDKPREVWLYRDWVVSAINQDLPYDQFVIEQLAGDLLPNATQAQKVATGFLRNSMINEEGGVDPEQFRMEAMYDRMDAIGKAVLGLTIQCSQCHTHKFDPISHSEYYRMFAFLNQSSEGSMTAYAPAELQQRASVLQEIDGAYSDLRHRYPDWKERVQRWESSMLCEADDWKTLEVFNAGDNSQRYYNLEDQSILVQGYAPTRFTGSFTNTVEWSEMRAVRIEMLNDPNLPAGGPGRSPDGLFALSEFKIETQNPENPEEKYWVKFTRASSDVEQKDITLEAPFVTHDGKGGLTGKVEYAIDGNNDTAWGIDIGPGRRNQPREAVFVADKNFAFPSGARLAVHLVQTHGGWNSDDNQNMNLGRFRLSVSANANARARMVSDAAQKALAKSIGERSEADWLAALKAARRYLPEWQEFHERIELAWDRHPEGATQLVLNQMENGRATRRLIRGDFLSPAEEVTAGVPDFLHDFHPENPDNPTRLDFARWLVDERSPTTARSMVNRIWQAYFGVGLVETSEDLGSQSAKPSNPELLDWLAVELMESGWSLKHIHSLIVNSATYQQSSHASPDLYRADPDNRLLGRGPRFRVDAEIVRDIALAASGLLDPTVGGPSVYPPAPEFLFQPPASYGPKTWETEQDSDRYRRALYTFRFRSIPYPALEAFDAPNGDISCVRRSRSNTPQQALAALNEPLFLECARALAQRTLAHGGTCDEERIEYAFRQCLTRQPDREELDILLSFFKAQKKRFEQGELDPKELLGESIMDSEVTKNVAPVELAAWSALSRTLLNLDETITKE